MLQKEPTVCMLSQCNMFGITLRDYTYMESEHSWVYLVGDQNLVLTVVSPDVNLHLKFLHVEEVVELLSVVVDGQCLLKPIPLL